MPLHPNLVALDAALAQAQSPSIKTFLDILKARHPHERLMARSDFDPADMPALLPDIVLTAVEWPGPRFLVKVAGEHVREAHDRPLIGRYIDTLFRDDDNNPRFPIVKRMKVVETGCLVYRRGRPRMRFSLDFANVEYCHFPLAEDGVAIDHILSIILYEGGGRHDFGGK